MRVVSRNCTEDGWSEPFPHYVDACGFDEYESETGDQVSICPHLEVVGVEPRRPVAGCSQQRPCLLLGLQEAQVPRQPTSTCCVPKADTQRARLLFIHSGPRSIWFAV